MGHTTYYVGCMRVETLLLAHCTEKAEDTNSWHVDFQAREGNRDIDTFTETGVFNSHVQLCTDTCGLKSGTMARRTMNPSIMPWCLFNTGITTSVRKGYMHAGV